MIKRSDIQVVETVRQTAANSNTRVFTATLSTSFKGYADVRVLESGEKVKEEIKQHAVDELWSAIYGDVKQELLLNVTALSEQISTMERVGGLPSQSPLWLYLNNLKNLCDRLS